MSTGSGYDMILLSIKGPGGARVAPARTRAPRHPRHHASRPKKRRGLHHRRPSTSSRPMVHARQQVTQEPTAPRAEVVGMTTRHHEDRTTTGGDAPHTLSPTARLLPHGLVAPRRALSFGLDNAAVSLARTICPNAQTYVENPMVLPRDTGVQQRTSELPDFSQVRGLRRLGPGGTRSPRSGSGCWKRDVDVSTPPSRTPISRPIATTLLGNAIISTGW